MGLICAFFFCFIFIFIEDGIEIRVLCRNANQLAWLSGVPGSVRTLSVADNWCAFSEGEDREQGRRSTMGNDVAIGGVDLDYFRYLVHSFNKRE